MSDPHTILKLKGWGKESSKKRVGGSSQVQNLSLLSTFPQGQLAAPRSARGWVEKYDLFHQLAISKAPAYISRLQEWSLRQSFLDFYNPMIKTIVDKSTEYTMPCPLPIFCFQFQNGYWRTDSLHSWMPGGKWRREQGRVFGLQKTFILLQQKF